MHWPFDFIAFTTILLAVASVVSLAARAVQPSSRPGLLWRITLALGVVAIFVCVGARMFELTVLYTHGPEREFVKSVGGVDVYRHGAPLWGKEYAYQVVVALFAGVVASAFVYGVMGAARYLLGVPVGRFQQAAAPGS